MRLFRLERDTDITGVSGTGIVAEGCEFDDGTVALRWRGDWATTVVHDEGMASVHHINGHDGKTRVVWLGYDNQALSDVPAPESTTERGFGVWADLKDFYDKGCVVVTSSLATEHCVWIQNEDGNAHLDGDMAVKVRDALNAWLLWVGHPAAYGPTGAAKVLADALRHIGTECSNYTSGDCVSGGRSRNAEYMADRWCDECIAREALAAVDPRAATS